MWSRIKNWFSKPKTLDINMHACVELVKEYDKHIVSFKDTYINLPEKTIASIVEIINQYGYKNVFYVGCSDKNLVVQIKNIQGCTISLADWYDVTNKQKRFWWDPEDELDPIKNYPAVPEWAIDVPVQIEGIPKHDILLLDILLDDYMSEIEQHADAVVLFGEAKIDNFVFNGLYEWSQNEILVGILKEKNINTSEQVYQESIIAGRKVLLQLDKKNQSASINFGI